MSYILICIFYTIVILRKAGAGFVLDAIPFNNQKRFLLNHSRDINPICMRIILFEGITRDGDDNCNFDDRSRPFMNLLLEHLDAKLPSLAIQA